MKKVTLILALLVASPCFGAYTYRRSVTVDHTKLPSTQSHYPVGVFGTLTYLKTVGNGGRVQSASGFDIVFTSDLGCSSLLPFERVVWGASTGAVEFWVNVTSVSSSVDTVFYMCYGNAAIVSDQQNQHGTWDANFIAVYHLPDGTTLSYADSTTGANNGTPEGSPTAGTGVVDGDIVTATATDDGVDLGTGINFVSTATIEAWYNGQARLASGKFAGISGKGQFGADGNGDLRLTFQRHLSEDCPCLEVFTADGNFRIDPDTISSGPCPDLAWVYVAGTYDGTNMKEYMFGGGLGGPYTLTTTGTFTNNAKHSFIGRYPSSPSGNGTFPGFIDEVRISNIVRTSDWLTTTFNNIGSPGTFYTIGAENVISGGTHPRVIGPY